MIFQIYIFIYVPHIFRHKRITHDDDDGDQPLVYLCEFIRKPYISIAISSFILFLYSVVYFQPSKVLEKLLPGRLGGKSRREAESDEEAKMLDVPLCELKHPPAALPPEPVTLSQQQVGIYHSALGQN